VPKNLMSRPANGRLTALLKLDLEQLKEAVAAPPAVECGCGRRRAHTKPWSPNGRYAKGFGAARLRPMSQGRGPVPEKATVPTRFVPVSADVVRTIGHPSREKEPPCGGRCRKRASRDAGRTLPTGQLFRTRRLEPGDGSHHRSPTVHFRPLFLASRRLRRPCGLRRARRAVGRASERGCSSPRRSWRPCASRRSVPGQDGQCDPRWPR
jgi:hypothetical protein